MRWNLTRQELPTKSGEYEVMYSYNDRGEEKQNFVYCYFENKFKIFDIEKDYLPQCKVIRWRE